MAAPGNKSCLAVVFDKCDHMESRRIITSVPHKFTFMMLFEEKHGSCPKGYKLNTVCSENSADFQKGFECDAYLTVGDVMVSLPLKGVKFTCTSENKQNEALNIALKIGQEATNKAVDAFQVLMAKGRQKVSKKTSSSGMKVGLSRKDELYNDVVNDFADRGLDFPKSTANSQGSYFVQDKLQVLANALWYITNQHSVINNTAMRKKDVISVPSVFDKYSGYNDTKRKKIKELPMSSEQLDSHSQALYSLLLKPVCRSSPAWEKAAEDIKQLADCLLAYKKYLKVQAEIVEHNRSLNHPVRTIDEHATIEHRHSSIIPVKSKFSLLDNAVKSKETLDPVVFQESDHLESPFESNVQRYRYFSELQLSVPIDIIRFCPGGSVVTTYCIVKVTDNRSEAEMLTQGARLVQKVRPFLSVYHTRTQKTMFREKLKNVTHVLPSVADLLYKELTLDASTATHPVTQERLRLIFLGHQGLITDLRHLNPGRPTGNFDMFFEKLGSIVEENTAADDRRHNTAHLAQWLSLKELIKQAEEKCEPGTPIPSKDLVRLQFSPRNPYTKAAVNFTSRIPVQYKIQRRQLRAAHPDDHYCAAQLKYLKERAVEMRGKLALFFCDDKAKVPVGEPGIVVSTGVRGKKSIAPVNTTFGAMDHDMTCASITPSVILQCDIPDNVEKSFYRGKVTTISNDSIFQASSPFRHAAALVRIMRQTNVKMMMKFTDGGTDQRNTLEAVKCATICIFQELDLDMIILTRCAPGQSWTNPAELVMSILNIALQNCALERAKGDDEMEAQLRKCGSMASIRSLATTKPEIKIKWKELIEPVQAVVMNRFSRLSLKEEPFTAMDPVSDEEIDILQRHLRELFPDLDLTRLQKVHTKKVKAYTDWVAKHCRERQYSFQIRKCEDGNCCLPSALSQDELQWLPDPVIQENDNGHFKPYQEVKQLETTEDDRPSLKKIVPRKKVTADVPPAKRPRTETEPGGPRNDSIMNLNDTEVPMDLERTEQPDQPNTSDQEMQPEQTDMKLQVDMLEEPPFAGYNLCTSAYARTTVTCVECSKPRVIYSKFKLTERQTISLVTVLSEYDYTCGAPITPPGHSLHAKVMCRENLSCAVPVEIPYYSTQTDIGRKDICSHCGAGEAEICADFKKCYKTVLPICNDCTLHGKKPIVSRPYGLERK